MDHACSLQANADVFCWGLNDHSQLGLLSTNSCGANGANRRLPCEPVPARVPIDHRYKELSLGTWSTCGVAEDDAVYCWGVMQLPGPNDSATVGPAARRVPLPGRAHGVSAGGAHACAIDESGDAYCWGANDYGQLGRSTVSFRLENPSRVGAGIRFQSIVAGQNTTCGITTANEAYCWGRNINGQVGDGTTFDRSTPTRVSIAVAMRAIWTGNGHACGLAADGAAYCWGRGDRGQLGDGLSTGSSIPVRVTAP